MGPGHGRQARSATTARAVLIVALLAGAVTGTPPDRSVATQAASRSADGPASLKPTWRMDAANTGHSAQTGPATLPAQVFTAQPEPNGETTGVELDGAGNVLFATLDGAYYSYSPPAR
jgi:hypothetical protein